MDWTRSSYANADLRLVHGMLVAGQPKSGQGGCGYRRSAVSSSVPDASAMERFCHELLPEVLRGACDVEPGMADEVGRDVLMRARSFAAMTPDDQFVISAPFVEESFFYEPAACRYELRAAVTVVAEQSA